MYRISWFFLVLLVDIGYFLVIEDSEPLVEFSSQFDLVNKNLLIGPDAGASG